MGFENSAGLGVSNHYGPRVSGGNEGVTRNTNSKFEFSYDSSDTGLGFGFPAPGAGQASVFVTAVYAADQSLTLTSLDIGGVAVEAASVASPVEITSANTGVLSGKAGTAVRVVIEYTKSPV